MDSIEFEHLLMIDLKEAKMVTITENETEVKGIGER